MCFGENAIRVMGVNGAGEIERGSEGIVLAGNTVPLFLVAHYLEFRQTTQYHGTTVPQYTFPVTALRLCFPPPYSTSWLVSIMTSDKISYKYT